MLVKRCCGLIDIVCCDKNIPYKKLENQILNCVGSGFVLLLGEGLTKLHSGLLSVYWEMAIHIRPFQLWVGDY